MHSCTASLHYPLLLQVVTHNWIHYSSGNCNCTDASRFFFDLQKKKNDEKQNGISLVHNLTGVNYRTKMSAIDAISSQLVCHNIYFRVWRQRWLRAIWSLGKQVRLSLKDAQTSHRYVLSFPFSSCQMNRSPISQCWEQHLSIWIFFSHVHLKRCMWEELINLMSIKCNNLFLREKKPQSNTNGSQNFSSLSSS